MDVIPVILVVIIVRVVDVIPVILVVIIVGVVDVIPVILVIIVEVVDVIPIIQLVFQLIQMAVMILVLQIVQTVLQQIQRDVVLFGVIHQVADPGIGQVFWGEGRVFLEQAVDHRHLARGDFPFLGLFVIPVHVDFLCVDICIQLFFSNVLGDFFVYLVQRLLGSAPIVHCDEDIIFLLIGKVSLFHHPVDQIFKNVVQVIVLGGVPFQQFFGVIVEGDNLAYFLQPGGFQLDAGVDVQGDALGGGEEVEGSSSCYKGGCG